MKTPFGHVFSFMASLFNGYIYVTLNLATMVVFNKAYSNALSTQLTTSIRHVQGNYF